MTRRPAARKTTERRRAQQNKPAHTETANSRAVSPAQTALGLHAVNDARCAAAGTPMLSTGVLGRWPRSPERH
eukprot:13247210-Alexandrium_andersonii.AAC.1